MPKEVPEEIHLRDHFAVILKRKWTVITFFIILVTTATIWSFKMEPIYKATCQILIERENPNVVKIEEVMAIDASGTDYYQTQYEILKNNDLAERAINRLSLDKNPEFNPKSTGISFGTIIGAVSSGIKSLLSGSKEASSKEEGKGHVVDKKNQIIKAYLGRLGIQPIRNSRLVNITFEAHNPELASQIANTHAKLYIEQSFDRKFSASHEAVAWLNERINGVRRQLEESEAALQRYRQERSLVSIDLQESHNIHIQKLNDLNAALTQAKTKRMEKENLFNELNRIAQDPQMVESMSAVVANPLIQQLKAEYVRVKGKYAELSQKYGPEHSQMTRLGAEINEIKDKIRHEVKNIANSIDTEYRVAKAQEKSLIEALETQKKEALALNQKEIQYNVLKRDVDSNRTLYESMLQRLKEASVTENLEGSNISIVDPAKIPDAPSKPKKMTNIILAIICGLTMGIGLAFFLEYLDNTIKTAEDVERHLNIPFLGPVGRMVTKGNNPDTEFVIDLKEPNSSISEQLRNVRTNILFSASDNPRQALLLTSAVAREGKTFLATNLAISMAQMGKKVLLVDADMRKPRLHKIFGLKKDPGLTNILAEDMDFNSVVHDTEMENLKLITCGTTPPNPSELLASKNMGSLIETARKRFDTILFDSPPVMSVTDPLVLSTRVDGTIMVIKSADIPRPPIQRAIKSLSAVNARILGGVLNNVDFRKDGYYYQYYYRYYYGYGYGEKGKEKEEGEDKEGISSFKS